MPNVLSKVTGSLSPENHFIGILNIGPFAASNYPGGDSVSDAVSGSEDNRHPQIATRRLAVSDRFVFELFYCVIC